MLKNIPVSLTTFLFFVSTGRSIPIDSLEAKINVANFSMVDDPEFRVAASHLKVDLEYEKSKLMSGRRDNIDERGPYFEGDMVLSNDQLTKQGLSNTVFRWPQGIIPYAIDTSFTSTEVPVIMQAIVMIQNATCIRFIPRANNYVVNYVYIRRGAANSGCFSDVGMNSGTFNNVNIQPGNPGCVFVGIIAHELIHAIGVYHEQSRTDRDSYVTINWSNIQSGQSTNFNKWNATFVNSFGVPYDYGSIMHYSAYAFAINTNVPTITPTQSVDIKTLGQRNGLSPADVQIINTMYSGYC